MNHLPPTAKTKFLLIATFKSHKTKSETESWVTSVAPIAATTQAKIVVAPSLVHLSSAYSTINDLSSTISLAAQDVSPFPPGSYTGAVNATQLQDLGVEYCLVGHSERRKYFHETHTEIASKIRELIQVGITPVLCLSKGDIEPQLAALDDDSRKQITFVYEPPADIGGTETAPIADITTQVELIRTLNPESPVLYGGSVNAGNLASLTAHVDGVLVSTASLDPQSFIDIIHSYQE